MNRGAPELLVSIDLEMNQPSGKIIQVGCALHDRNTGLPVEMFFRFVNPGEPLDDRIAKLTGTTQDDLDRAGTLNDVYQQLVSWIAPYDEKRALNPLTWGGGDAECLRDQLGLDGERWLFGRRWIDVKTLYTCWRWANGHAGDGGLARAMTKMGLRFEGRKHNALDDAINTFRIYSKLERELKIGQAMPSFPEDTK